jgi:lipoic acid synthetase
MPPAESPRRRRLPPWLKKRVPAHGSGAAVRELLADLQLNTVCRSAHCPNAGECFGKGRATFLLMGPHCTRRCTFCAVSREGAHPLDPEEPARVAEAVARLELRHAVVTSVTRDDLPDGGAAHFAATVRAIRARHDCTLEVLTPDFGGDEAAIAAVAESGPEIFNHNVETVPRLYPAVRPDAEYGRSLALLAFLARRYPDLATKSGIMAGLGETREELRAVCADLHRAGVRILTIGQYLAPSPQHHPVAEFVPPEDFAALGRAARELGVPVVAAAPFVRSSYNAEDALAALRAGGPDA